MSINYKILRFVVAPYWFLFVDLLQVNTTTNKKDYE